jgi:hypothetical protein
LRLPFLHGRQATNTPNGRAQREHISPACCQLRLGRGLLLVTGEQLAQIAEEFEQGYTRIASVEVRPARALSPISLHRPVIFA